MSLNTGTSTPKDADWWQRASLCLQDGSLSFAGYNPARLASELSTPLFLYDAGRIEANLRRLADTLATLSTPARVFYAMKANRAPDVLALLSDLKLCGIDVCSPGEMLLAIDAGFAEEAISYTGTSVSDADIEALHDCPQVAVNCDSLSMIRRLGKRCPGRRIGLRVNPGVGLGYRQNPLLQYSGLGSSKFGIYRSQLDEAIALCGEYELRVVGVHFHCGCGYLTPELPLFGRVLQEAKAFLIQLPNLRYVNIGGGLGIPLVRDDEPLDLAAWAALIEKHLCGNQFEIWVEPGDYIVKDAGILVLEVNTVEEKGGTLFVGVNGGFNLHPEPAFYDLPLHVVPCRWRAGPEQNVTVAGNINESLDILAHDILLPPICEGDLLSFLNAGGYGSSMSSNHCCRGRFEEHLLKPGSEAGAPS